MSSEIIIVIPARAGSKRISNKNLRTLGGRTLVEYAIEIAKSCKFADRVILSTDHDGIAEIGRAKGIDVPFQRPSELAGDDVSLIPVLQHVVAYQRNLLIKPRLVVSLQPTSPFIEPASLDAGIEKVENNEYVDSVVSVTKIAGTHPMRAYRLDNTRAGKLHPFSSVTTEKFLQGQDLPEAFGFTGGFYIRKIACLDRWDGTDFALGRNCVGQRVSDREAVDINTKLDFFIANALLEYN